MAYAGGYDAGSSGSPRYIPFGSGGGTAGPTAMAAIFKPFERCKVTKVAVVSSTNPSGGSLDVYKLDGTNVHSETFSSGGANEEIATYPDLTWPGDGPLVVRFFPGAAIDEVGAVVIVEEITD